MAMLEDDVHGSLFARAESFEVPAWDSAEASPVSNGASHGGREDDEMAPAGSIAEARCVTRG